MCNKIFNHFDPIETYYEDYWLIVIILHKSAVIRMQDKPNEREERTR